MSIWRLVRREIAHRRLAFVLAVLSVAAAAGLLVAHVVLLRAHDARTEAMLAARQQEADRRLAKAEDDYRKYMKELGYNLLILPADQSLAEFWTEGHATRTMPEANVARLSATGTTSIRHLLPLVQQKVRWPEERREIILIGTRGEVPIRSREPKEPMLLAVAPGKAVVGGQLARDLELAAGDRMTLLGREFEVQRVEPARGSAGDMTVWIDLATAQQLLGLEGRIHAIEALKCYCAGKGGDELRSEIIRALPDTQVVLRENRVTVRAKSRERVKQVHQKEIAELAATRAGARRDREQLAAIVMPLVIVGAAVWTGLLALANVRDRRAEIAILRAVGVRASKVFAVFMTRAVLVGLVGAIAGCTAGALAGAAYARAAEGPEGALGPATAFAPLVFVAVLLAAPALSALASWAPAMFAARQDPAVILQEA